MPNFATIAAPLMDLSSDEKLWKVQWSDNCDTAFKMLKETLCCDPVLFNLDFLKEFILQTDSLEAGRGLVLSEGEEHLRLHSGQKLFPHERAYSVIENEALNMMWAIDA